MHTIGLLHPSQLEGTAEIPDQLQLLDLPALFGFYKMHIVLAAAPKGRQLFLVAGVRHGPLGAGR